MTDPARSDASTETSTSRFGVMVVALTMVIVVALAGLWIVERGKRRRAEQAIRAIEQQMLEQEKKMQGVGRLLVQQVNSTVLDRSALPAVTHRVDGEPRSVLVISASRGERLGLQGGDLLMVTPPPPPGSQPASAPAE